MYVSRASSRYPSPARQQQGLSEPHSGGSLPKYYRRLLSCWAGGRSFRFEFLEHGDAPVIISRGGDDRKDETRGCPTLWVVRVGLAFRRSHTADACRRNSNAITARATCTTSRAVAITAGRCCIQRAPATASCEFWRKCANATISSSSVTWSCRSIFTC